MLYSYLAFDDETRGGQGGENVIIVTRLNPLNTKWGSGSGSQQLLIQNNSQFPLHFPARIKLCSCPENQRTDRKLRFNLQDGNSFMNAGALDSYRKR